MPHFFKTNVAIFKKYHIRNLNISSIFQQNFPEYCSYNHVNYQNLHFFGTPFNSSSSSPFIFSFKSLSNSPTKSY